MKFGDIVSEGMFKDVLKYSRPDNDTYIVRNLVNDRYMEISNWGSSYRNIFDMCSSGKLMAVGFDTDFESGCIVAPVNCIRIYLMSVNKKGCDIHINIAIKIAENETYSDIKDKEIGEFVENNTAITDIIDSFFKDSEVDKDISQLKISNIIKPEELDYALKNKNVTLYYLSKHKKFLDVEQSKTYEQRLFDKCWENAEKNVRVLCFDESEYMYGSTFRGIELHFAEEVGLHSVIEVFITVKDGAMGKEDFLNSQISDYTTNATVLRWIKGFRGVN